MIDGSRFEIMPFAPGEAEAAALPEPVRLTVTCSPTHGVDRTVEVATRLRGLGHQVTVHLAARMVRDRSHLDDLLTALARADICGAFVIGGDATPPHGPYSSAVELLPIIHEHPCRPRTIGIAGYPEGHPLIDSATLAHSLRKKSRFADYITTQLCFNPKSVLAWTETIRRVGVGLPVIVGLPGIVDRRRMIEIAVRLGVGPSLNFLRKRGSLSNLMRLSMSSADRLQKALSPFIGDPRFGIAGFHYFTFNRLLDTWRWERTCSSSKTVDCNTQ